MQINILFQTIYAYCTALGLIILRYSTVCFKKAPPAHLDLDPSDLWLPVSVHRLVDRLVVGVLGEGHGEGQGGGQAPRQDGEEALKVYKQKYWSVNNGCGKIKRAVFVPSFPMFKVLLTHQVMHG